MSIVVNPGQALPAGPGAPSQIAITRMTFDAVTRTIQIHGEHQDAAGVTVRGRTVEIDKPAQWAALMATPTAATTLGQALGEFVIAALKLATGLAAPTVTAGP